MAVQVAPVDPNVRLPAAVVAATQRATALQEEMRQERENAGKTDAAPQAPPAEGAGAHTPAPSPSPQPASATTPVEPDLEHKLRSAEGRLAKAERERQALASRLAALELQRVPRETQPPRQQPAPPPQKLITPEEEEEFGAEFLGVVGKKAREELAGELFKIQRQISDLSGNVNAVSTTVVADAREKMKAELDQALPAWREINYNDHFISWLALPDPFSGGIRHELLKSAYTANQTGRVLAFFKAYVAEEAAGSPPSPGTGTPPAAPNGATPPARVSLESLAAPGRASPAAPTVPADKPVITRGQITQFYADVAAGKYRGREAEKLENDAAIILAANEGRIV